MERRELKHNTMWEFVAPGAQWRNSKAERRVRTLKKILSTIFGATFNPNHKSEYNYSEFQSVMKHVTTIANDRPIDLKVVREDLAVPVMVNHLSLDHKSGRSGPEGENIEEHGGYGLQHELISQTGRMWWDAWQQKAPSTLVPYRAAKDAEARPGLAVGDAAVELKDSKFAAKYSLARVVKAEPSKNDGSVRTVTLAVLPKNFLKKTGIYDAAKCKLKPAAAQNMVPLATSRGVEEKFAKFITEDADDCYELEAAMPLEDKVTDPDGVLDG